MKKIAVILAGGTGSRIGSKTPKQFLQLSDGRTVIEHTIDAFETADCIDEIVIIMHHDWISEVERMWLSNAWQKVSKVLPGGKERWESSWNAIKAYTILDHTAMILHDAARPWVSQRIIRDVCEALETHKAVTVAVPMTDTVYRVDNNYISDIPQRTDYMRAQTPQAFHLELLHEAYQRAIAQGNIEATDDCGIVHRFFPDETVYIVQGEEQNRKITYKDDLL